MNSSVQNTTTIMIPTTMFQPIRGLASSTQPPASSTLPPSPNLSGNELYEKTGLVGEWPFTIMASL